MPTAEEKVKLEEKQKTERDAAVTGAQAVAEAVKRAADDAARAASLAKTSDAGFDFYVNAAPGGTFHIRGDGFSSGGSVLVAGKAQTTYEWGPQYIRGKLDDGVKSGEVVVQIDPQTKKTGYLKVA